MENNEQQSDEIERNSIVDDIEQTIFVGASAGTGKTKLLVDRVYSLLTGREDLAPVRLCDIAIISFTENAAAELRERIRLRVVEGLKIARQSDSLDDATEQRCLAALDDLDGAAILTLHGFARRILADNAVEAALPLGFEVRDETATAVAFDDDWPYMFERLLAELERLDKDKDRSTFGELFDSDVRPAHLRDIAKLMHQNYDRLSSPVWNDLEASWEEQFACEFKLANEALLKRIEEAKTHICDEPDSGKFDSDKLVQRLKQMVSKETKLRDCLKSNDVKDLKELYDDFEWNDDIKKPGNLGKKETWGGEQQLKAARDVGTAVAEQFAKAKSLIKGPDDPHFAMARTLTILRAYACEAAEKRKQAGVLDFHDLLVCARNLLCSDAQAVIDGVRRKFRHVLMDEFQDTDPLQIEIATAIASEFESHTAEGWCKRKMRPGSLFCVGDVKQSIYRFRRADAALFSRVEEYFREQGGEARVLTRSFRSTKPIVDWVNTTFDKLMRGAPTNDGGSVYQKIEATRTVSLRGPAVTMLGVQVHDEDEVDIATVRQLSAKAIASTIESVVDEGDGWTVEERAGTQTMPHDANSDGNTQPIVRGARYSDIAVLLPRRTALPQLERAFKMKGISYRLEASSLVWHAPVVRDLMMCLRAIANPSDEFTTVHALRSSIFACGDDELYQHRRKHDRNFSLVRSSNWGFGDEESVSKALEYLHNLHQQVNDVMPATLIEQMVRDYCVMEHAASWQEQSRDSWRHIRFLTDQARLFAETQVGGLREFVDWVRIQSTEGNGFVEAVLPETDENSVRIMTIHAAKGLEFPIAIIAGLESDVTREKKSSQAVCESGPMIKVNDVSSPGYSSWKEAEATAEYEERLRLLYVGCTRAQDHLIVSLHRNAKGTEDGADKASFDRLDVAERRKLTRAELLWQANAEVLEKSKDDCWTKDYTDNPLDPTMPAVEHEPKVGKPWSSRAEWEKALRRAQDDSWQSFAVSATKVAEVAKSIPKKPSSAMPSESRDADLDAEEEMQDLDGEDTFRDGRRASGTVFATTIGSAVHEILELIDLRQNAALGNKMKDRIGQLEVDELFHNVTASLKEDHKEPVRALVECALRSEVVIGAGSSEHHKEVHVGTPFPGIHTTDGDEVRQVALEGFIDLLYECPDTGGVVVVDYKTDKVSGDELRKRYLAQGITYAHCVKEATGKNVSCLILLLLKRDGSEAEEVRIEGEELERGYEDLKQWVAEAVKGEPRAEELGEHQRQG